MNHGNTHWSLVSYMDRHLLHSFVLPGDSQSSLVPWSRLEHFGAAKNTREASQFLYVWYLLTVCTNLLEMIQFICTQLSTLELEVIVKAIEICKVKLGHLIP